MAQSLMISKHLEIVLPATHEISCISIIPWTVGTVTQYVPTDIRPLSQHHGPMGGGTKPRLTVSRLLVVLFRNKPSAVHSSSLA